ncbi:MAG: hypothetical protein WC602_01085 [archaeon]
MSFRPNEKQLVLAAILIAIAVQVILLAFFLPYPNVPDVFERQRVSEFILQNGSIPQFDSLIAPNGVNYVYPPLADLILAGVSAATGLAPLIAWKVIAVVLFAFFLFFCARFAEKYLPKPEERALLILFLLFAPLVLRRFVSFVAETVGLAFYPLLFYLIYRKKFWLAGICLAIIGYLHFRTFFTALLVLAFFALLSFARKENKNGIGALKTIFAGALICGPFYIANYAGIISLSGFANPFIDESFLTALKFLGLPLLLFAIIAVPLLRRFRWDSLFAAITIVPLAMVLLSLGSQNAVAFPYREAVFLLLPLAILAAFSFSWAFKGLKSKWMKWALALCLLAILAVNFSVPHSAFLKGDELAISYIKDAVPKGKLVLSDYSAEYWLEYEGYSVAIGPFMERLPDAGKRLETVKEFLDGKNGNALKEFRPECVFFRQAVKGEEFLSEYEKKFASGNASVYCLRNA